MWGGIEPSLFYDHWGGRVVVALVSESLEGQTATPFEIRPKAIGRGGAQILAPTPTEPGGLPRLPEGIRALASSGSILLLFPTHPDEVAPVASNWAAALEDEKWFEASKEEGHLFFVDFEVGDNPDAFAQFLRPERALWQSLHHFHPAPTTEYHLNLVEEALELGELLMSRFFEVEERSDQVERRSTQVAHQARCDTAARTLVFEKRDGMRTLAQEARATSRTSREGSP